MLHRCAKRVDSDKKERELKEKKEMSKRIPQSQKKKRAPAKRGKRATGRGPEKTTKNRWEDWSIKKRIARQAPKVSSQKKKETSGKLLGFYGLDKRGWRPK